MLLVICLMFGFYLSVWVVDFGSVNSVVVVVIFVLLCLIVYYFRVGTFGVCVCCLFDLVACLLRILRRVFVWFWCFKVRCLQRFAGCCGFISVQ